MKTKDKNERLSYALRKNLKEKDIPTKNKRKKDNDSFIR